MLKPQKTADGLNITINTNEDCNLACKYDLPEGTKILMADFTEKNIEDVKPGDEIIGFDEFEIEGLDFRRIKKATVLDGGYTRSLSEAYVYKVNELDDLLEASGEHPVLTNDEVFKTTEKIFKSEKNDKCVYKLKETNNSYFELKIDISKIKYDKPKKFYNLTTSSRTFIANKILVHNCYELNKKNRVLDIDYAKKFIDIVLNDPDPVGTKGTEDEWIGKNGVILDFIGGDSLMQIDLLEEITDYFVYKMNQMNHRWKNDFYISLSSNGTLFENPKVRHWIEKWKHCLSLGVSIDGCPVIHDKNRIFAHRDKNGNEIGSMPTIMKWWPWYKKTLPNSAISTKATCSKDSIPYLFESLRFMYEELGIIYINQNFIMEDAGIDEKDIILLDDQLKKCCDYILERSDKMYWSMIDKLCGSEGWVQKTLEEKEKGRCGSGNMPALSLDGLIYPCFRWLPMTQVNTERTKEFIVGDIWKGLYNKTAGNLVSAQGKSKISSDRCRVCKYSDSCAYCIAGCYCEFGEFKRTEYICEISKLMSKYSDYYWNKYKEKYPDRDLNVYK